MLNYLLEQKKCFKLICGAGNEDLAEVEKLVALYSKAGCRFFDIAANEEVFKAAKRGLDFSIPKEEQRGYSFCLSVGIKGEPHLNKARINQKFCQGCKKCFEHCPQDAIGVNFQIHEEKCIGCLRCSKACQHAAIEIFQKNKPIEEMLNPILGKVKIELANEKGTAEKDNEALRPLISCIELHASGDDEQDVTQRWQYLSKNFDGMLSVCIDRSKLGNMSILKRIQELIKDRKPYTTIIQADGAPMSGGEDDYKTTLQAVAMAEIFQNARLPAYILLSGGTNSKSLELARICGIEANGVSIGSYARKIVKTHLEREDFLENKTAFSAALKIAEGLVSTALRSL